MKRITIAALLVLAACGGTDEPQPSASDCTAVRRTLEVAVNAANARNGEPPAGLAELDGLIDPEMIGLDWYTVTDGTVEPDPDGPC